MKRKLSSKYYDNLERIATQTLKRPKLDCSQNDSNKVSASIESEAKPSLHVQLTKPSEYPWSPEIDQLRQISVHSLSPTIAFSPPLNHQHHHSLLSPPSLSYKISKDRQMAIYDEMILEQEQKDRETQRHLQLLTTHVDLMLHGAQTSHQQRIKSLHQRIKSKILTNPLSQYQIRQLESQVVFTVNQLERLFKLESADFSLPLSQERIDRLELFQLVDNHFAPSQQALSTQIETDDIVDFLNQHLYNDEECLRKQLKRHSDCNICLKQFKAGDQVRILPCKHVFHAHCIDVWLSDVKGSCVVCRTQVLK